MHTKIMCGCGLYTATSLEDYDQHLGEVAQANQDLTPHIKRTSVVTMLDDEDMPVNAEAIVAGFFPSHTYFRSINDV